MTNVKTLWQQLQNHQELMAQVSLKQLFDLDSQRFQHCSLQHAGIFLDYSKNHINSETLKLLCGLAEAANLNQKINDLFSGQSVNISEKRPALHTALRCQQKKVLIVNDHNIMPDIKDTLQRMQNLSNQLNQQLWLGATNKPITDILHIGIGGSELGPKLVSDALAPFKTSSLKLHFLASVDGTELANLLQQLTPETTLVIVASKSLSTKETLLNTEAVKLWLLQQLSHISQDIVLKQHLICVTQNIEQALLLDVAAENILPVWPWVGGRYSIWSAMGLPIALVIGGEHFEQFLAGAHAMDVHFRHSPLDQNMPVLLGLLGIWYNNFFNTQSHVILPYDYLLQLLPDYLQQLVMESNGKCWQHDGNAVVGKTSAVLWGKSGLIGQHSFYQLLHQGTHMVPADFIVCAKSRHDYEHHHQLVLANCFAQSQALMVGTQTEPQNIFEQQKYIPGNRPSNTLVLDELTPYTLGALLALYEHKVFTQSVIWNINPFDQWSVELGKQLSSELLPVLQGSQATHFDASTNGLVEHVNALMNKTKEQS